MRSVRQNAKAIIMFPTKVIGNHEPADDIGIHLVSEGHVGSLD